MEELRRLIGAGINPNAQDDEGNTALIDAAQAPNPEAVKVLLEAGADLEAGDHERATPLMWAVRSAFDECYDQALAVVELLLASGADVNARTDSGATALIYGVSHGLPEVVELLMKAGADVNALTNAGWSALDYAEGYGERGSGSIELLVSAGAERGREGSGRARRA